MGVPQIQARPAEAQAVGIPMRPMVLLIFGDPKTGSPLMDEYPSLAIDLPLKALAWKSTEGKVYLSFNSAGYLAERHQLAVGGVDVLEGHRELDALACWLARMRTDGPLPVDSPSPCRCRWT